MIPKLGHILWPAAIPPAVQIRESTLKNSIWIAVATAMLATPLLAQDDATPAEDESYTEAQPVTGKLAPFDAIDRNNDEMLSWEEVRNQVTRIFYDTDLDGDESIDHDEFTFNEDHWKQADLNHNNLLSLSELIAHAAMVFGVADTDGDDQLSREEGAAIRKKEKLD
jgi:hypothetical protein